MKAYPFEYIKADSLDDVFAAFERYGPEARIIAGGQSLVPMLNFRLARPGVLVDINGIDALSGIVDEGETVRIGALTRHAEVADSDVIARRLPLVAEAMGHVAHPAVRNRGTFGGSLCLADPAAELPACVVALQGELTVQGPGGRRTIHADSFFQGMFETALAENEILTHATIKASEPDSRFAMDEIARRHGDYAIVGACASARTRDADLISLRLVFFGVEDRPVCAANAAAVLADHPPGPDRSAALRAALAEDLSPNDDHQASATMRRHLAAVLAERLTARLTGAGAVERESQ